MRSSSLDSWDYISTLSMELCSKICIHYHICEKIILSNEITATGLSEDRLSHTTDSESMKNQISEFLSKRQVWKLDSIKYLQNRARRCN